MVSGGGGGGVTPWLPSAKRNLVITIDGHRGCWERARMQAGVGGACGVGD